MTRVKIDQPTAAPTRKVAAATVGAGTIGAAAGEALSYLAMEASTLSPWWGFLAGDAFQIATYAVGVGPFWGGAAGVVAAAHERCLGVHPYTVNQTSDMATMLAAGVDGMFTNNPDLLDGLLGEDAFRGKRAARRAARMHRACLAASS